MQLRCGPFGVMVEKCKLSPTPSSHCPTMGSIPFPVKRHRAASGTATVWIPHQVRDDGISLNTTSLQGIGFAVFGLGTAKPPQYGELGSW